MSSLGTMQLKFSPSDHIMKTSASSAAKQRANFLLGQSNRSTLNGWHMQSKSCHRFPDTQQRHLFSQPRSHRPFNATPVSASSSSSASTITSVVESSMHTLPDGMRLEVLRMSPAVGTSSPNKKPPLLFIHGSYHAAWCWKINFMPYFSSAGYDTVAISVRGQGGSDRGDLKVSGDLESHANDLASFISSLSSSFDQPPILIGHSFGGLLVEKYASQLGQSNRPPIAGVALLCSVPPSGNKDIVVRITKSSLKSSFTITMAFVFRTFAKNLDTCRTTFFSPDIPVEDLKKYQAELAAASPVRLLDLGSLNKVLPLPPLPAAASGLPTFVAGGETDLVVDPPAVAEAAEYFGVQPIMWKNMAHDCMLDTRWKEAAESLENWLDTTSFS